MADQTREQLYERIRQSSRDEVIVEEMVRLGFWPEPAGLPDDPAEEIRRQTALQKQLRALQTEAARLSDIEALKREARRRRMEAARLKRAETKQRRLQQRAERAAAYEQRKQHEIGYLGAGVSAGLGKRAPDTERLAANGLPVLSDAADLAKAMGISVGQLRFLAFDRRTSRISHYVRFKIPKRSGGQRTISAPMGRLKRAQRWILDRILAGVPPQPAAHGFVPQRSIVTNARLHVGAEVVVNVDLQDFFPTVTYRRVKGLFTRLGYAEEVATLLALICTEAPTEAVELDGVTYHVATGDRRLPQGAPTSPAITNLICRNLDRRLARITAALDLRYSRYADDLTFSGSGAELSRRVGRLLRQVGWVVGQEGFVVHPSKTRVMHRGRRQEVTGLVVNDRKPTIARATLRRFRATLYQIEKDGPQGKRWGRSPDVIAAVCGFANFVSMVDSEKGAALKARVRPLVERYGTEPPAGVGPVRRRRPEDRPPAPTDGAPESKDDAPKKKRWWKLF